MRIPLALRCPAAAPGRHKACQEAARNRHCRRPAPAGRGTGLLDGSGGGGGGRAPALAACGLHLLLLPAAAVQPGQAGGQSPLTIPAIPARSWRWRGASRTPMCPQSSQGQPRCRRQAGAGCHGCRQPYGVVCARWMGRGGGAVWKQYKQQQSEGHVVASTSTMHIPILVS